MEKKLLEYGFPQEVVNKLLKGKTVVVPYGKVKLNGIVLETTYEDGRVKLENL